MQIDRNRVPVQALLVPAKIATLAKKFSGIVCCNLRPSQRRDRSRRQTLTGENCKEWLVSPRMTRALSELKKTKGLPIRMVILAQGALIPDDVGTIVIDIKNVLWDGECRQYPGLVFMHPTEGVDQVLWGGYILAFACIGKRRAQVQVQMGEELFIELVPRCQKLPGK